MGWGALLAPTAKISRPPAPMPDEDKGGFVSPPPRGPSGKEPPSQPPTGNSELKRQLGNPDAPGHPDGMQNCDMATMEERLLQEVCAEDDWVDLRWT